MLFPWQRMICNYRRCHVILPIRHPVFHDVQTCDYTRRNEEWSHLLSEDITNAFLISCHCPQSKGWDIKVSTPARAVNYGILVTSSRNASKVNLLLSEYFAHKWDCLSLGVHMNCINWVYACIVFLALIYDALSLDLNTFESTVYNLWASRKIVCGRNLRANMRGK